MACEIMTWGNIANDNLRKTLKWKILGGYNQLCIFHEDKDEEMYSK